MSQELTPWFPEDVTPVREGVYEVETVNGTDYVFYCHFDGRWGTCGRSVDEAFDRRDWRGLTQDRAWRGLANNPKEQA